MDGSDESEELGGCDDEDPVSPSSQESGLGTMHVMDESLGSLEELTDHVHQQLEEHFDHASAMQYELDSLRAQLSEKNRIISCQQATIKQLQEAISCSHLEVRSVRKAAETELNFRNETISSLQLDLAECQQQYADCFQQVVNQDRLLAEIRDDDALLFQKISFLESQLNKSSPATTSTGTQTEQLTGYEARFPVSPTDIHRRTLGSSSVHNLNFSSSTALPFGGVSSTPKPGHHHHQSADDIAFSPWRHEFRELLSQVRHKPSPHEGSVTSDRRSEVRSNDLTEWWHVTLAEEKQHRLRLEHSLRHVELEFLEVKDLLQSCRARHQGLIMTSDLSVHERPRWNHFPSPAPRSANSLFTLV